MRISRKKSGNMKKKLNNKGFALVETLVGAMFVSIVFIILFENYFPLMAKYKRYENYDDLDSKYIAYHVRELIYNQNASVKSNIYNKLTTSSNKHADFNGTTLCNYFTDSNEKMKCTSFLTASNINKVYLVDYNTQSLKNNIKTDGSVSRAFELYINYIPTFSATAGSKSGFIRLIVEIKHEDDTVEDSTNPVYFYTYSNIELDKTK